MPDLPSTSYPVTLPIRIDWSEMDLFGHVNNVMFMKYIQAGRVNYWEQIGINEHHRKTEEGPMLLSTECRFFKPLYFPGDIRVLSGMEYIGNSSFCIRHKILNEKDELAAEAKDVMVFYDFRKESKLNFPEEFKKRVEKIEGRSY